MKLNKKQIVNALLGLSVTAILMTFMKKNFDELVFIVVLGVVVTGIIVINSED
jgi:mannose/fructose/N-acetylgalactosamine-specific phosphotransferase system component IID